MSSRGNAADVLQQWDMSVHKWRLNDNSKLNEKKIHVQQYTEVQRLVPSTCICSEASSDDLAT